MSERHSETAEDQQRAARFGNFEQSLKEFLAAGDIGKPDKGQKLSSQIHLLARTPSGLKHLYDRSLLLESNGFFEGTPWQDTSILVPGLIKGTLQAGHPASSYEIISDLRILARLHMLNDLPDDERELLNSYLEEAVVHNLEFAFRELSEESRLLMPKAEVQKAFSLFEFLLRNISLERIKSKIAVELELLCAQRLIVTVKVRKLIELVADQLELDSDDPVDNVLQFFVNALYSPSALTADGPPPAVYKQKLSGQSKIVLEREAQRLGYYLGKTGLSIPYLAVLLRHLAEHHPQLIPTALSLSKSGIVEWERHQEFILKVIKETVMVGNHFCLYGLSRVLEKNLFSRRVVRISYQNLRLVIIHPNVQKRILKSMLEPQAEITAKQYLLGAVLRILGQPLGIRQGNNATCQSARGISLWCQHAPAKLINMIITVCSRNNLVMRFENQDLESLKLAKGLVDKLDYQLDAVSVVLVPHLDKIYSEMMRRASGRGEDPHKWVNPAFYGHWVQVGFAGAYDYLSGSIRDFKGFIRRQYLAFHPEYNGGTGIVYPSPVGIFITSSTGKMVGFHAISILRVKMSPDEGIYRIYFLNPNSEGRQDWGQDIKPSVFGHGEKHGESSLPFEEMAARIYAFHYNPLTVHNETTEVPDEQIDKVYDLARNSWGRAYLWVDNQKIW